MRFDAYEIDGQDRNGRWLVTCDHASNAVPGWVAGGDLGISPDDMTRHIAWDVGAAGLARGLAERLGGAAILSTFSRLVIDANRGEDDPTLVMKLYDGTIIPANRHVGQAEVTERLNRLYRPYHDALEGLSTRRADTVICAVHSYTPCLRGRAPRPWHVGILYSHRDTRLALPLMARLRAEGDLCVGDNEPYSGHLEGDSIDTHALRAGRANVLVEVRNDLISDPAGQADWADRLARVLMAALADSGV